MIEEIPLTQLLSVIVPVHNESAVLSTFHARMRSIMEETGHPFEIIYVDDGSSDDTLAQLQRLRDDDTAVAVLELSRNFGKEVALSAGLDHAGGEAVILIDADLQDPPELVHSFLQEWKNGYDVVYGLSLIHI